MEAEGRKLEHSSINVTPKVTVGLMVYNEEKYLEKALDCILTQSLKDCKVIVADNCSTDRTKDIAENMAAKDTRITYYRHSKNIGALENYNWLVRNTDTEYFVLAGAHDIWPENYLGSLFSALEKRKDAVLAYAPTVWIDETDNPVLTKTTGYIDTSGCSDIFRFNLLLWADQHAMYGMCRRNALLKTRLQLKIVGSGAILLAELALLGSLIVVPETRWYRRINRNPETRDQVLSRYAMNLLVTDELHLLPHWRIPIAYYGSVLRSNLSMVKKIILIFCITNVFIVRRNDLILDLIDLFKKIARFNSNK